MSGENNRFSWETDASQVTSSCRLSFLLLVFLFSNPVESFTSYQEALATSSRLPWPCKAARCPLQAIIRGQQIRPAVLKINPGVTPRMGVQSLRHGKPGVRQYQLLMFRILLWIMEDVDCVYFIFRQVRRPQIRDKEDRSPAPMSSPCLSSPRSRSSRRYVFFPSKHHWESSDLHHTGHFPHRE